MKKSIWMIFIFFCLSSTIFAGKRVIRFATDLGHQRARQVKAATWMNGFDLDIAKAMCHQLNAKCIFEKKHSNQLLPGLEGGQYDAVISAVTTTGLNQQNVAFTQPYFQPGAVFLAPKNKKYNLIAMTGKKIGVKRESAYSRYLSDKYRSKVEMQGFRTVYDALTALSQGKVDLVLVDHATATEWLKQHHNAKKFAVVDKSIIDPMHFGSGYGIAVKKGNEKLLRRLNMALYAIQENGIYSKISKFYFGPIGS